MKIDIDSRQFGHKVGKHAVDFGLDPSNAEDRSIMADIICDIVDNHDEIRHGNWRGQGVRTEVGRKDGEVDFYVKGNDVVIMKKGIFITIIKNGINNPRVKYARKD